MFGFRWSVVLSSVLSYYWWTFTMYVLAWVCVCVCAFYFVVKFNIWNEKTTDTDEQNEWFSLILFFGRFHKAHNSCKCKTFLKFAFHTLVIMAKKFWFLLLLIWFRQSFSIWCASNIIFGFSGCGNYDLVRLRPRNIDLTVHIKGNKVSFDSMNLTPHRRSGRWRILSQNEKKKPKPDSDASILIRKHNHVQSDLSVISISVPFMLCVSFTFTKFEFSNRIVVVSVLPVLQYDVHQTRIHILVQNKINKNYSEI